MSASADTVPVTSAVSHTTHGAGKPGVKATVDVKALSAALKGDDTSGALAALDAAGADVDDEFLFWDYVADASVGLPAATCLHYGAHLNSLPIVAWALGLGANPAVRDAAGRTPMDVTTSEEVKAELLRAGQAFAARTKASKRPGPQSSPPQAPPRAPTDRRRDSDSKSSVGEVGSPQRQPISDTGGDGSPHLSSKAAELLREAERQKQDRKHDRLQRSLSSGTLDATIRGARDRLTGLEDALHSQLSDAEARQHTAAGASAALLHAEVALAEALQRLQGLEAHSKHAAERRKSGEDDVLNGIMLRANEELASLDCRAAVVEAATLNEPPSVIKDLLLAVHFILQDNTSSSVQAVRVSSPGWSPSRHQLLDDASWHQCRQFIRSDEFLEAMFQASPEQLATQLERLAVVRHRVQRDGLTKQAVTRACVVFEPMYDWLHIQLAAADELARARLSDGSKPSTERDVADGAALQSALDAIARCRDVVSSKSDAKVAAEGEVGSSLATARTTLSEIAHLRGQLGMTMIGLWDGSDDVTAVIPHGNSGATASSASKLRAYDSSERLAVRKGSVDGADSDSKMYSPRRRSVGDSSPPNSARPASRDGRPSSRDGSQHVASRLRRASIGASSGVSRDRQFSESKDGYYDDRPLQESGETLTGVEQWPDDVVMTGTMRRRSSTHSNSPLRRQSLVGDASSTAAAVMASIANQESPKVINGTGVLPRERRGSASGLDSPQIRRIRVSSGDGLMDPDIAVPLQRGPRISGDSTSSLPEATVGDSSGSSGSPVDAAGATASSSASASVDVSGSGVLAVRRSSFVKVGGSPLRRKSAVGGGLVDPAIAAAAAASAVSSGELQQPVPGETLVQRVRRMSIGAALEPSELAPAIIATAVVSDRTSSSSTSPLPTASPLVSARHSPSAPSPTSNPALRKAITATAIPGVAMPSASSSNAAVSGIPPPASAALTSSVSSGSEGSAVDGMSPTSTSGGARRNSIVQRPSPLRRASVVEGAATGGTPLEVKPTIAISRPLQTSPEHSRSPEPKAFMSPNGSAFKRRLTASVSPSLEKDPRQSDKSSTSPPHDVSPEASIRRVTGGSVEEQPLLRFSNSDSSTELPAALLVPGRTPVRVLRTDVQDNGVVMRRALPDALSLNMEAVNTPVAKTTPGSDAPGSRPGSARLSLSSGRPSSARRLVEALAYGEELSVRSSELGLLSPPAAAGKT